MFSAPLEVNFYVELIRGNFGQHQLTQISLRALKNVKILKNGPLTVCNIESCWNGTSANIGDTNVIQIENKEINHINSENVVKEFKKLTKARKSWKPTANKRGSKRKSDYMKQNVKRVKVKPELSWAAYYLMEWIFPIQFSFRECFDE